MIARDVGEVTQRLQRRRREILEAGRRAVNGIELLRRAERDPEIEEASQSEQLQYDLAQLGEVEARELAQIDAAIARLDAGEYGRCRECVEEIDPRRLAALPFAVECDVCAARREQVEAIGREAKKRSRVLQPG